MDDDVMIQIVIAKTNELSLCARAIFHIRANGYVPYEKLALYLNDHLAGSVAALCSD
jgi:hypothetical protein